MRDQSMTGPLVVRDQSVTRDSDSEGSVSEWVYVLRDQSVAGFCGSEGSVSDWRLW